jgi:hypothetical protein
VICLDINRRRNGALQVVALTTSDGPEYAMPPVERHVFDFTPEDSVSEVGVKVFEWVAGELERQGMPKAKRESWLLEELRRVRREATPEMIETVRNNPSGFLPGANE